MRVLILLFLLTVTTAQAADIDDRLARSQAAWSGHMITAGVVSSVLAAGWVGVGAYAAVANRETGWLWATVSWAQGLSTAGVSMGFFLLRGAEERRYQEYLAESGEERAQHAVHLLKSYADKSFGLRMIEGIPLVLIGGGLYALTPYGVGFPIAASGLVILGAVRLIFKEPPEREWDEYQIDRDLPHVLNVTPVFALLPDQAYLGLQARF